MKNKIKKIIKIILCNIILLLFLVFLCDLAVYYCYYAKYTKTHHKAFKCPQFSYVVKPYYGVDIRTYFDGSNNVVRGRTPDGLEYSDKTPIVIFGCSYAQGQFLNYNQTFSYKLAHLLKRPVYNRAYPGRGIQFMYWQSISSDFYNSVPPSDTVIYVLMSDHYRRLLIDFIDVLDLHLTGHFNKKGNDFVLDGSNYLKNILISSYSYKVLHAKYIDWYINNPKHEQELTDLVLEYFIKTRENLEKNWHKKIKFTIVFYNDKNILYKETLFAKLKAAGFNVIETDKITSADLNSQEYLSSATLHPTEKAWDELTPLIAKDL